MAKRKPGAKKQPKAPCQHRAFVRWPQQPYGYCSACGAQLRIVGTQGGKYVVAPLKPTPAPFAGPFAPNARPSRRSRKGAQALPPTLIQPSLFGA